MHINYLVVKTHLLGTEDKAIFLFTLAQNQFSNVFHLIVLKQFTDSFKNAQSLILVADMNPEAPLVFIINTHDI